MNFIKNHKYILIYSMVFLLIMLWPVGPSDAMGYSFLSMWVILPIGALVIGILEGRRKGFEKIIFFIFAAMSDGLCQVLTFNFANVVSNSENSRLNLSEVLISLLKDFAGIMIPGTEHFEPQLILLTAVPALVGILIGVVIRVVSNKKERTVDISWKGPLKNDTGRADIQ